MGTQIGSDNASGDSVKQLDMQCNDIMKKALYKCSCVHKMVSEEDPNIMRVNIDGEYFVAFDPLDGSSNIDSNISVGTIFCVFRYNKNGDIHSGRQIVMSGYSVYGGCTLLVVCIEGNVQMFGLNPDTNEWELLESEYKMKQSGPIYALNESNKYKYNNAVNKYADALIKKGYTSRWVGSLVADVHRTLIKGGVVLYPDNTKYPNGRIRLLYEAYPMAYVMEYAGGYSFDGKENMLDLSFPWNDIHKKIPIYYGSNHEMTLLKHYLKNSVVDSSAHRAK